MQKLTLSDAKQRLNINNLWRVLGLPGEPKKTCRCPFHQDHSPSLSISHDGQLWHCFAGCGGGDAIDFLQAARGVSKSEACREFLRIAGGNCALVPFPRKQQQCRPATRSACKVELTDATPGTEKEWKSLAMLRNLSIEGVALAAQRGLLLFGEHKGHAAWFVADSTRHNAQARRMDGQMWIEIGGKKAWTICERGNAGWPVGAKEAAQFPSLAFVEGGPDLLAAFSFIYCEERESNCSAVAMLGAALDIHPEALPYFSRKRIRIFGHTDANGAGRDAVERWADQLTRAGAVVDAFNFAGLRKPDCSPVKDLNDALGVHADDFEEHRELWSMMP